MFLQTECKNINILTALQLLNNCRDHHWYSIGTKNGFPQSISGVSDFFLFFFPSGGEQKRQWGSVFKGKSSLLCGRSHRHGLADGMTGQSRYPERVSCHGNCSNSRALCVIAFASALWCDSREMSVYLFSNHTVDRMNTKRRRSKSGIRSQ